MNQELVKARKALYAGKDTECNLPCYLKGLAGAYYRLANYNLSMQYAAFAEAVQEGDLLLNGKTKRYEELIKQRLEHFLEERNESEEAISSIQALRKEITVAMQALTAYTDRLYLHEYVLRRMEPGMEGSVEEVDSYAALEEISNFLFCDEEQEGLLARVAQTVAELPVRMTKAKFLEWIRSTASVYKDADAETLDRVFYMLYSASGLYEPEGMELFPECKEALAFFSALEYRNLSEEQYFTAKGKLEEITEFINSASEVYFSLMELANSLMTVFLTAAYVTSEDLEATKECDKIFRLLLDGKDFTSAELVEAFESFEGAPEEIEEFLFQEEGYFEELPVDETLLEAMMQKTLYARVLYAKRLHTTSLFVDLEDEVRETESFDLVLDKFCEAVTENLEAGQRPLNRAVMAQVIHNLPLPFTKKSEIQKYILAALENCHDMSEKTAAMRAIRELAEGI